MNTPVEVDDVVVDVSVHRELSNPWLSQDHSRLSPAPSPPGGGTHRLRRHSGQHCINHTVVLQFYTLSNHGLIR